MSGEATTTEVHVTLRGYVSASEYSVEWQTEREPLQKVYEPQPEHSYSNTSWLDTFKLEPGDYLFANWYTSDEDDRQILIRVPLGTAFQQFVEAAAKAAQSKWRDDTWVLEYAVQTWSYSEPDYWDEAHGKPIDNSYPLSLSEALDMHKQTRS